MLSLDRTCSFTCYNASVVPPYKNKRCVLGSTLASLTPMFSCSPPTVTYRLKFAGDTVVPSGVSMSAAASTHPASSLPQKTVRVEIKGRVQGVCFRDWTVENASELGLRGWVRNRRNGSVEAVFSGDPDAVQDMVERRCRVGPPSAVVTGIATFPWGEDPGQGFQRKPTV